MQGTERSQKPDIENKSKDLKEEIKKLEEEAFHDSDKQGPPETEVKVSFFARVKNNLS